VRLTIHIKELAQQGTRNRLAIHRCMLTMRPAPTSSTPTYIVKGSSS